MKVLKHGNKKITQQETCECCGAILELIPCEDIVKGFDYNEYFEQGAFFEYFICPECKEKTYLYFKLI